MDIFDFLESKFFISSNKKQKIKGITKVCDPNANDNGL